MNRKNIAANIYSKLKKIYLTSKIELNYSNPVELFVAVVLSARTTDKQVNIVTKDLFKKYKSIDDYIDVSLGEFEQDVKRIGLYKSKAKNIKAALEIIKNRHNSKLPDSIEELIKLPGVGRKIANILLFNIYGKNEGIAVDTHFKRLSRLFGLTDQTDPDKIEQDLMKLIPQADWGGFSARLVLYGRYDCRANCKHETCPLKKFIKKV